MPYFPIDDNIAFHPKIVAAGNEAMGLWMRAGALCKKHATGGFVPERTARALGSQRLITLLVEVGLWEPATDPSGASGYRFHDWEQQAGNADAATEKARAEKARANNAERQRRHRERNTVTNTAVTKHPSPSPSDLTETSRVQSSLERAKNSTDPIPILIPRDMEQRAATVYGITSIRAIIEQIAKHAGRQVTPEQALQVSNWILRKAPPHKRPHVPQRYVHGAIARSPAEIQQHIDTAI